MHEARWLAPLFGAAVLQAAGWFATPAHAVGEAVLLRDLNPGQQLGSGSLDLIAGDSRLFVVHRTPELRGEVWVLEDGSAPRLLRVLPEGLTPFLGQSRAVGDRLFATLHVFFRSTALWTSDGTRAGTFGPILGAAHNAVVAGEDFGATLTFDDIWFTDFTPHRQWSLRSRLPELSAPRDLMAVDGALLFTAFDGERRRLYRLDRSGLDDGTFQELDPVPDFAVPGSTCQQTLSVLGDDTLLLVRAAPEVSASALGLYRQSSLGPPQLLTLLAPDAGPGSSICFSSSGETDTALTILVETEAAGRRCELWLTDGTAVGSALLAQRPLAPDDPVNGCPTAELVQASRVYYGIDGQALVFDRTTGSTAALPNPAGVGVVLGGVTELDDHSVIYRVATDPEITDDGFLVRFDGSTAEVIAELQIFENFAVFGGDVYFPRQQASDTGPLQLWRVDAVGGDPELVFEWPFAGADSNPVQLLEWDGAVAFVAEDDQLRRRIWLADGESGAVEMVSDHVATHTLMGVASEALISEDGGYVRAWRRDAQFPEIVRRFSLATRAAQLDGRVLFRGVNLDQGVDGLWVTDGSFSGTQPIRDFIGSAARADWFSVVTGRIGELTVAYFQVETPGGLEIWATAGTQATTHRVVPAFPAPSGEPPHDPRDVVFQLLPYAASDRGQLFFLVLRGDGSLELWSTPGAGSQATPVPLPGEHTLHVDQRGRGTFFKGRLAYFTDSADGRSHLWLSDGTVEGTRGLSSFARGPTRCRTRFTCQSPPLEMVAVGDRLFFDQFTYETGLELWVSDGSSEGTRLVADLSPGPFDSDLAELTAIDGVLVFAASTAESDWEPWRSDGTPEGTFRLADIEPGVGGSEPVSFTAAGELVVFSARRTDVGRELFAVPRSELHPFEVTCETNARELCLDDRIRIGVDWLDRAGASSGLGRTRPFSDETGLFSFYEPDNLELAVKVLDGRAINGSRWLYGGALSDVAYWLTATDVSTGHTTLVTNEQGNLCGFGRVDAFPDPDPIEPPALSPVASGSREPAHVAGGAAACDATGGLCLKDGRFRVTAGFLDPLIPELGEQAAQPVQATADSGHFWFFEEGNLELTVKVLDGRSINGAWWVYFGALSDVAYSVVVTDLESGAVKRYESRPGTICGQGDVSAFPDP
jgi:ELWxxDGT repeat protein